ncbi:MAG: hypothetical protein PF541_00260 [Prolixibacteraceae bacterium]|jgi:hypothetical protein|nr:hypothetical protein [Prolixibacteraceae bacterium]
MEIDEDMDLSHHVFYFPLPPIDTLSANAKYKYSTSYDSDFMSLDYSASGEFRLGRSSNVWVKLINFTQEEIKMQFADGFVSFFSGNNYSEYLYFNKILSGQNHKLDFYEIIYVNSETYEKELEYLGSTSRFIKTQLPDDSDKVEWFMPLQTIEIDFNTLEK